MKYEMIAIDLDGTLLNSNKEISKGNLIALEEAVAKGVKIILCSGRIFSAVKVFARQIGIDHPMIACNGAIIRDIKIGKDVYINPLTSEDAARVIEICHGHDIYFHAYVGDTMYVEELNYVSLAYWEGNQKLSPEDRIDIKVMKDFGRKLNEIGEPVTKIVVMDEDRERLFKIRKVMSAVPTVTLSSSCDENFEVMNKGVGKGKALDILSGYLGIPRQKTMAMGDNENDLTMLEFAEFGVAMANAIEEVKSAADYITLSNDEDGVGDAIRKFVL